MRVAVGREAVRCSLGSLCGARSLQATPSVLYLIRRPATGSSGNVNEELIFLSAVGELLVSRAQDDGLLLYVPSHEIGAYDYNLPTSSRYARRFHTVCGITWRMPQLEAPTALFAALQDCLPEKLPVESVAHIFESSSTIVVLSEGTTRLLNLTLPLRRTDFTTELDSVAQKLYARCPDFKSLVLTLHPKDAAAQGFLDKNGRAYDYAVRCFTGDGEEDPLTGKIGHRMCTFSRRPLWDGTVLGARSSLGSNEG